MVVLIKVLSIALIVYGCFMMLRPKMLKKILDWVKEGERILWASGAKVVVGILMMISSRYCSIPWVVLFIGALMAFSGAAAFVIKKNALIHLVDAVEKKFAKSGYIIGAIALIIGAVLALAA